MLHGCAETLPREDPTQGLHDERRRDPAANRPGLQRWCHEGATRPSGGAPGRSRSCPGDSPCSSAVREDDDEVDEPVVMHRPGSEESGTPSRAGVARAKSTIVGVLSMEIMLSHEPSDPGHGGPSPRWTSRRPMARRTEDLGEKSGQASSSAAGATWATRALDFTAGCVPRCLAVAMAATTAASHRDDGDGEPGIHRGRRPGPRPGGAPSRWWTMGWRPRSLGLEDSTHASGVCDRWFDLGPRARSTWTAPPTGYPVSLGSHRNALGGTGTRSGC